MTLIVPAADALSIFSSTLNQAAETTPFYLVKSVLLQGTGMLFSYNEVSGHIAIAFNVGWGDSHYALAPNTSSLPLLTA